VSEKEKRMAIKKIREMALVRILGCVAAIAFLRSAKNEKASDGTWGHTSI